LQIENLRNIRLGENVMAAIHTFGKSEGLEQRSKVIEMDVGIRVTAKNLEQKLLAHNPCRRV
jgi:hypothetical protein